MTPGRNKTYEQLTTINMTITPTDLARLNQIPGHSRHERITFLLDLYDTIDADADLRMMLGPEATKPTEAQP